MIEYEIIWYIMLMIYQNNIVKKMNVYEIDKKPYNANQNVIMAGH